MADDANGLAGLDGETDAVQRQKAFVFPVLFSADLGVGILLAPKLGDLGLQLRVERGAADGAKAVFLGDILDLDHWITHVFSPV